MNKEIGKITKNSQTDIVIVIDDFGGKPGLTVREFTKSDRYTGFTKSGTRVPAERFLEFKDLIDSIKIEDFPAPSAPEEGKAFGNGKQKSLSEETESSAEVKEDY